LINARSVSLFSIGLQMHLADIDIPGKIRNQESESLSPGNQLMTFDTGM